MHQKRILTAGKSLGDADKVLIMLHGRGASAEDILSLSPYFDVSGFSLLALRATNNSWYPFSFMAPPDRNEPWLSSALSWLKELVNEVIAEGITAGNIYFLGFSQGACLTLEFVARHAAKYGGVVAFTGGLIGDKIYTENYKGDFDRTAVFLGSADPDPHVPVERVHDTAKVLESMHASVTEKLYSGMGHTICEDEIHLANELIFKP